MSTSTALTVYNLQNRYGSGAVAVPVDPGNDNTVSASTAARIEAGTAESTRRAYARQWREFTAWAAEQGRTALPASDATLAEYASHLCDRGLAPGSVEQGVACIRRAHRDAGHPGRPDTRGAQKVIRSHRRWWAEQGHRVRQAPPADVDRLRAMVEATDPDSTAGLRDRCLLVLGFALMARRSELAGLDLSDVAEVPEGLVVRIRRSKTDQDAKGADVAVPFGSRPDTCPVRCFWAWRARLAEDGVLGGPLFRRVDRWQFIGDGLTGGGVRLIVKAAAARAGVDGAEDFSAHSLRAGGATSAARAGVPAATIARHGRWSPTSPVVHTYVRQVDRWKDNPMAAVGL